MPVYAKPMVYYPLHILILSGMREVMLISTTQYTLRFAEMLVDCARWCINIQFTVQPSQDGLSQAFIIGWGIVSNRPNALGRGDNIFTDAIM
jgi:glucose-1-phosphate thymidylyltransferase